MKKKYTCPRMRTVPFGQEEDILLSLSDQEWGGEWGVKAEMDMEDTSDDTPLTYHYSVWDEAW